MESKEQLVKELKEKTRNMKPWNKIIFAFLNLLKTIFITLWVLIKYLFFILLELIKSISKILIFIGILFIFIKLGYSFLVDIVGENPVIDLSKYNIIIIISATLCLLTIQFMNLVEKDKKMTDKKRDYLRQSAELFFSSTIYFCVIYIFSLMYTITQTININILFLNFEFSKNNQDQIISILILIIGLIAVYYFFQAIYYLFTKIGTIYEFPEERDGLTFWQRVKKGINNQK